MPVFEGTGKYGGVDAGTPQVAQRRLLGGQADGVRSGADGDDRVELIVSQLHRLDVPIGKDKGYVFAQIAPCGVEGEQDDLCLLYTSPSPRDTR